MATMLLGEPPAEIRDALDRRRELGQDVYDEVWEGTYVVAPASSSAHALLDDEIACLLRPLARQRGLVGSGPFNLGEPNDYRVPDRGLHRGSPSGTWLGTCALAVEILSPDDATKDKLAFYASHGVEEVLIIDPADQTVEWLRATGSGEGFEATDRSQLLGVLVADFASGIAWPTT